MCSAAKVKAKELQERELAHSAKKTEEFAEHALELAEGKDGEFVSITGRKLSTLTADSTGKSDASRVGKQYLEQYNVWGDSE
jgi:hypothetical protein